MKKLYLVLFIFTFVFSCMKFEEIDRDDGDYVDYSVSEAKNYYYRFINESPLITKHKTRGNKENSLLEIDISPDWHNTISGYKNGLISINVPIFDGRDALALKPAINGVTNFVHVVQKLIVVKDERTDKEGAYLMTFIPDVSFCPYPMKMDVNSFINSGNKGEYSGWVVYSIPMTSYIVRLNYYKEGVKRKAYHLFGDKEQNRASIKKIYDILTGMAFGKIPDAITRHKGSGTLEDPFQMEPLILQYIPIPPDNHDGEVEDLIEWDEPDGPDPDPDDFDEPLELEDPEGPDEDPEEPQKPNPPIVILVDCTKENEDLAESANDILTNFKANGLNDFIANYKDADVEYAQSLYYGSDEDGSKKWLQGEIVTNNQPYSVNIEYGDDYVTSIHNHPTGNPHSVKDILGLAEMNAKYSDAKTSYVISSDGSLFVLYLEDSAKAQAFYEKYNGNTSEVDQGYSMAITYITPHSDEKTAKLHALAYVLEKYNTGMKILRREVNEKGNEGFRVRQTSLTLDERGMSTVVLTRCK